MNTFKVTYSDNTSYITSANGTLPQFVDYLLQFGNRFVDENPVTGEETVRHIESIEQLNVEDTSTLYDDPRAELPY